MNESVEMTIHLPEEVYEMLCEFTSSVEKKTKQSCSPESGVVGLVITGLVQGKYLKVKDVRKLGVKI